MSGDQIALTFLDFDVEVAVNCSYDHLSVYDSNGITSVQLGKYCGGQKPADINTVVSG